MKRKAIALPGIQQVSGQFRHLWEMAAGKSKDTHFPETVRYCEIGGGVWVLVIPAIAVIALQRGDDVYELGRISTAHPDIVALSDRMTVIKGENEIAAERRAANLAKLGTQEAEINLREDWGLEVHRDAVYKGIELNRLRDKERGVGRSAAPELNPV